MYLVLFFAIDTNDAGQTSIKSKVQFVGLHYMIMQYRIQGVVVYVHASHAEKSG